MVASRFGAARTVIVCLVVLLAAVIAVSCSTSRGSTVRSRSSAPCPDVTGRTRAEAGQLSMGTFAGAAEPGHDYKLWVATQRTGVARIRLTVTGPDGTTTVLMRDAHAADGFAAFFPGLVPVTTPGRWTFSVIAGDDRMCVTARF